MPGSLGGYKERPPYAISSVDTALQLASMIQMEGSISVSEAAGRLNVAPSTAHRMLSMLVYRDFVVKKGHRYHVGPVLSATAHDSSLIATLRDSAAGPMTWLDDKFDELTTLAIRTGRNVRFIAEIECSHQDRVGHRTGMANAAHSSGAGIVLLSGLTDEEIIDLYDPSLDQDDEHSVDVDSLLQRVHSAREKGFGFDNGLSIKDAVTVAHLVRSPSGSPLAALGISIPQSRFDDSQLRSIVAGVRQAARDIELEMYVTVRKRGGVGGTKNAETRTPLVV